MSQSQMCPHSCPRSIRVVRNSSAGARIFWGIIPAGGQCLVGCAVAAVDALTPFHALALDAPCAEAVGAGEDDPDPPRDGEDQGDVGEVEIELDR